MAIALLAVASLALGETYKWEDAKGVHFTDDPSTIPKKYRKKALVPDETPSISIMPSTENDTRAANKNRCIFEAAFDDSRLNFTENMGTGTIQECASKCMTYRSTAREKGRLACNDNVEILCYFGIFAYYDDLLRCSPPKR